MSIGTEAERQSGIERDAGSFRDPHGGVVLRGGRIFRYLTQAAAPDILATLEQPWFKELVASGDVVASAPVTLTDAEPAAAIDADVAAILEHPRLDFVSYPYEWPFEMLRRAALHQLQLTETAFAHGYMIKDATPFNVQFNGTRPVFIDVPSFERYSEGEGWRAYAQFCRMFLNPLLLQSYGRLPFHPWLRSSLEGIDTDVVRQALPLRAKLRPAVFIDVVLQSLLNHRYAGNERVLRSASSRKISDDVVRGMLNRTTKHVSRLKRPRGRSAWTTYDTTSSHYSPEARSFKDAFVPEALQRLRPQTVWDLGCNTGHYSNLAASLARTVVAIDGDEASVGALYERACERQTNILPVVMDLTNPSPNQGWAQAERRGLAERGPADVALCLALVHHLAIANNVPLPRITEWLATIARAAIVEFVPKTDPMVQRLLLTRRDVYDRYTREEFESAAARHFRIIECRQIPDCDRLLYTLQRT